MATENLPEPTDVRCQRLDQLLEREGTYVTVETWQLRDVIDGRVKPNELTLFLAVQAHARRGRAAWPGNSRLAQIMNVQDVRYIKRGLANLEGQGWIKRWETDGKRMILCVSDKPPRGGLPDHGGVAPQTTGGVVYQTTQNHLHLNHPKGTTSPPPPSGGCASPEPSAGKPVRAKREKEPVMVWALQLADALIAAYPHATGRRRGRTQIGAILERLFKKHKALWGTPEHEQLSARIVAGVRREASMREAGSPYNAGLDTWINQARWEATEGSAGIVEANSCKPGVTPETARREARARVERQEREAARQKALQDQASMTEQERRELDERRELARKRAEELAAKLGGMVVKKGSEL